jgi:hypothetical protein
MWTERGQNVDILTPENDPTCLAKMAETQAQRTFRLDLLQHYWEKGAGAREMGFERISPYLSGPSTPVSF